MQIKTDMSSYYLFTDCLISMEKCKCKTVLFIDLGHWTQSSNSAYDFTRDETLRFFMSLKANLHYNNIFRKSFLKNPSNT